jgi:type IV secretory pathway VirB10-like protein
MDSRLAIGALAGLAFAGVFAWVALPDTGTHEVSEPVPVPSTGRDLPTAVEAAEMAPKPTPTRQEALPAAAPEQPVEGKRDWQTETLQMLEEFDDEHRLTRREMREVKSILHDLHMGLEHNQKAVESGKKPEKAGVHMTHELRLKTEVRLIEIIGEDKTDALRDVHPELSGEE